MTIQNFDESARQILEMSRDEARRLRHEYVGTEHLLLALIHKKEGSAAALLRNVGADCIDMEANVAEIVGAGQRELPTDQMLPFTSRAKKALDLAVEESVMLNHDYVGAEHLLLGLIREGEGIGAQVLSVVGGVSEDLARAEVLRMSREENA